MQSEVMSVLFTDVILVPRAFAWLATRARVQALKTCLPVRKVGDFLFSFSNAETCWKMDLALRSIWLAPAKAMRFAAILSRILVARPLVCIVQSVLLQKLEQSTGLRTIFCPSLVGLFRLLGILGRKVKNTLRIYQYAFCFSPIQAQAALLNLSKICREEPGTQTGLPKQLRTIR